ncbi:phage portal protein family protein [Prescottella equi]|uniref:phage portal protein family protein n=1 Tax=Rhodococcus hoagii TaxID=43767 RepID=UPI000A10494D|nr:hypothetical protein [Prescottella equi]ORM18334.1 hypothetical protein A5N74_12065 [Prescottella equi]
MDDEKPVAPSYEIGYVTDRTTDLQQWNTDEQVPELRWPQCNQVYGRMNREDGRIKSVVQAIGLPIRRAGWRLTQNGARDEVTEYVARNLGLTIDGVAVGPQERIRGRFSWGKHLQTALLMLPYGHSYFEQVYRIDDAGRLWLRKLAPRPQRTISEITVAMDGGLESITQLPPANSGKVVHGLGGRVIPVSRLVAYVRDPEPGDWTGESLLRPAYKHWLLKDELIRIQAAAARRNGMGVPVGTAAKADKEEVEHMRRLASAYQGGMSAGVGLAPGQALALLGVQGNLPDMQRAIEYHDKQMALTALAHFLNLDKGGSYSLASVLSKTFNDSVQAVGEDIRDVANAHVVEDLVDLQFGPDEPAPRVVFDEIGSQQDATASALAILAQAGLLEPDELLRVALRQKFNLPVPEPGSADDNQGESA